MKALICVGSLLIGGVIATAPTRQDIVWETSFADAKERAAREGKGIFHLQLFGKLDQELCWTNARTLKAVLLSDPQIQKLLTDDLVPSWESVHETAKVTIDFADGKSLRRTIGGNTVIYICRADGAVVDAFPGVYTKNDFLAEAGPALEYVRSGRAFATDARIVQMHRAKTLPSGVGGFHALSKGIVESPVILKANTLGAAAPLHDLSKSPQQSRFTEMYVSPKVNASNQSPTQFGEALVASDSRNNRTTVRPRIHAMMSNFTKPVSPSECTVPIYQDILGTDLSDPYLGLTKAAIPGTRGLIVR